MLAGRKAVLVLMAALVVASGLIGFRFLAKVPRPALVYPAGQSLESVRGNCRQGNELLGCESEGGPRSFLTVHAPGEPRASVQKMFDGLLAHGWSKRAAGGTARDFLDGGAPEDLQPLYCGSGRGCVGLFRFVAGGYVLAWFP